MRTTLRKLGNSSGVIIPKAMLAELEIAIGDPIDIALDDGRIAITRIKRNPRAGWDQAFRDLAEAGDDRLVWPEFANDDDADLSW